MVIAMGAAQRFVDGVIDDAQSRQIATGESQRRGGFGGVFVAFPKNAGTAFRG